MGHLVLPSQIRSRFGLLAEGAPRGVRKRGLSKGTGVRAPGGRGERVGLWVGRGAQSGSRMGMSGGGECLGEAGLREGAGALGRVTVFGMCGGGSSSLGFLDFGLSYSY